MRNNYTDALEKNIAMSRFYWEVYELMPIFASRFNTLT